MTLSLVSLRIQIKTQDSDAGYWTRFEPGLNIMQARNSWGKSTLLNSIVYALGLEGAFSANRTLPFGPAMNNTIDLQTGPAQVLESSVILTVKNGDSDYLRVERHVKSFQYDSNLVHVWRARTEQDLPGAVRQDMFVRLQGAATREAGFHALLERFLGLDLPDVPAYADHDVPLYLELLVPLFFVEQKLGWSGVSPRVPTYLRVKDPLRRSFEYMLGLQALERIKEISALRERNLEISSSWAESTAKVAQVCMAAGVKTAQLSPTPLDEQSIPELSVYAALSDEWLPLADVMASWALEIRQLTHDAPIAGDRIEASSSELRQLESEVSRLGASANAIREELDASAAELASVDHRIQDIDRDRARLNDVLRIQRLGGEISNPLLETGRCPTCEQSVDTRMSITDQIYSVEETVTILASDKAALTNLRIWTAQAAQDLSANLQVTEDALMRARRETRRIKDELVSPSHHPSAQLIRRRLELEERVKQCEYAAQQIVDIEEWLRTLASERTSNLARIRDLQSAQGDEFDSQIINAFTNSFRAQLVDYEFRSVSPLNVTIDPVSYIPVSDGFELSFDLDRGSSASDAVRAKWAYYTALLEIGRSEHGKHPGLLVLDEPRQQETAYTSLRKFLRRLDSLPADCQVIYATSEESKVIGDILSGFEVNWIACDGPHLLRPVEYPADKSDPSDAEEEFDALDLSDNVVLSALAGHVENSVGLSLGEGDRNDPVWVALAELIPVDIRDGLVTDVEVDESTLVVSFDDSLEGETYVGSASVDGIFTLEGLVSASDYDFDGLPSSWTVPGKDEDDDRTDYVVHGTLTVRATFNLTISGGSVESVEWSSAEVVQDPESGRK